MLYSLYVYRWVALTLNSNGRRELACDLVRARREAVAAHLPPGLFEGIAEFPGMPGESSWWSTYIEMTRAETEHAQDAQGDEMCTVTVDTPDEETLTYLRDKAQREYGAIRSRLLEPSDSNNSEEDFDDDYDPNDPEELRAKAQREDIESHLFSVDLNNLQVLGSIAAALKAHQQPDQE